MVQKVKNGTLSNQNKKGKSSLKARLLSNVATKAHRRILHPIILPALSSTSNRLETNSDYTTGAAKNKVEATAFLLRTARAFR